MGGTVPALTRTEAGVAYKLGGLTRFPAWRRWSTAAAAVGVGWAVGADLLPHGVPVAVVVLGILIGGLSSLTALGLVLVYRSTRIINFAQAEIGGMAASLAVLMVAGWHLPYGLAVVVGRAAAVATGWVVDATVVRRFFTAPRLILTVATVGLAQILGAAELGLPSIFGHLSPLTTFTTPFQSGFHLGPLVFNGDDVLAMIVIPAVLVGLGVFLRGTDTGIAVRAAADSNERALLLGIPVRRLSSITWMVAAGLSGIAAMLSAPILGPNVGGVAGPVALLPALAAAVVGRMESLPTTFGAAIGIGVFQQVVFWNYPRSSTVDVGLFLLVLVALLLQRRRLQRVDDAGLGGYVAVQEVRPVHPLLARLPEVRLGRGLVWLAIGLVAVVWPLVASDSHRTLLAYIAIYGIMAVSLTILTGWAGQISLGQFAFAGVGAATTASLLVHAHLDMFLALATAAVVGAVAATLVGLPALRIQGLFLAVATLAFGVPVSTYLLNSAYFPWLTPAQVARPAILHRIDLDGPLAFYYFCLLVLALAVVLARNYRRSRPGRALVAVRDNERGAASYAIEPLRAKLAAFSLSGAMAGVAGGLFAIGLRGIPFSGFNPTTSLVVFTMAVIGGVASVPGAVLGAIYVEGAQYFLHGGWQLLATGAGLLGLLMFVPGGLGKLVFDVRDRILRGVAGRRGLGVPSLAETAGPATEPAPGEAVPGASGDDRVAERMLACTGLEAGYGPIQVLFGVDVTVTRGEVLALLGTNGAGKSTVLRVIAGLLPAGPGGRVEFDGADVTSLDPVERVRRGLGTVPGGRGVFGSLTVAENLRLGSWLYRSRRDLTEEGQERVLELFPSLRQRLSTPAALLSGGEQQMLTLAQALLSRPRMLLIDELSLGLAPTVVAELLRVVRRVNAEGVTVVVVEQSLNIAAELAARSYFLEKGQVRFGGPTAELAERSDLVRSVFLRDASWSVGASPGRVVPDGRGPPVLELCGLTRHFGGITAVDEVDMAVRPGEILGLIGANGAGKTTLFDMISGFVSPDRGAIRLDDRDVTGLHAAARAAQGLGRSFQDARLFPSMTVAETLATALERHVAVLDPIACMVRLLDAVESEKEVAEQVEELLERLHLEPYRNAFVAELSTGTRRIVELACAMAHRPTVMLLDEPSSGIAQRETEALGELLLELRSATGTTLLVVEHDIPLVSSLADRLVCLHLGRVISTGRPSDVLSDPAVVAAYLGTDPAAIGRSRDRGAGGSPRYLTTADYARLQGITPEAVRRRIRSGQLDAVRHGRSYRIPAQPGSAPPSE